MKTILTASLLTWLIVQATCAQPAQTTPPAKSPSPPEKVEPAPKAPGPPIVVAPTPDHSSQPFVYEQKPVPARTPPVQPEQAQAIIDRFRITYAKLGSPRILIVVNRELVAEKSGLKSAELSLADKQTVRDVERLFGRPLRMGGVSLSDQRVATQLLGGKPFEDLTTEGELALKDREVLSKVADVVVEVLISSKDFQVSELSGDHTYTIPDIQTTAIRLKDAKILGQAASSDLPGRNSDVREVAEATALALMEDMLTGVK